MKKQLRSLLAALMISGSASILQAAEDIKRTAQPYIGALATRAKFTGVFSKGQSLTDIDKSMMTISDLESIKALKGTTLHRLTKAFIDFLVIDAKEGFVNTELFNRIYHIARENNIDLGNITAIFNELWQPLINDPTIDQKNKEALETAQRSLNITFGLFYDIFNGNSLFETQSVKTDALQDIETVLNALHKKMLDKKSIAIRTPIVQTLIEEFSQMKARLELPEKLNQYAGTLQDVQKQTYAGQIEEQKRKTVEQLEAQKRANQELEKKAQELLQQAIKQQTAALDQVKNELEAKKQLEQKAQKELAEAEAELQKTLAQQASGQKFAEEDRNTISGNRDIALEEIAKAKKAEQEVQQKLAAAEEQLRATLAQQAAAGQKLSQVEQIRKEAEQIADEQARMKAEQAVLAEETKRLAQQLEEQTKQAEEAATRKAEEAKKAQTEQEKTAEKAKLAEELATIRKKNIELEKQGAWKRGEPNPAANGMRKRAILKSRQAEVDALFDRLIVLSPRDEPAFNKSNREYIEAEPQPAPQPDPQLELQLKKADEDAQAAAQAAAQAQQQAKAAVQAQQQAQQQAQAAAQLQQQAQQQVQNIIAQAPIAAPAGPAPVAVGLTEAQMKAPMDIAAFRALPQADIVEIGRRRPFTTPELAFTKSNVALDNAICNARKNDAEAQGIKFKTDPCARRR